MKISFRFLGLSLLLFSSAFRAETPPIVRPESVSAASVGVGELVEDFSFVDREGHRGRISDYADKKAIILLSNVPGCPIGQKYLPTVKRLEALYSAKDVAFLFVGLGTHDEAEIAQYAKNFGIQTRYLIDKDGLLGRRLQIKSTTETLILDRKRTLVYRGPIDDQFGIGFSLPAAENHYLVNALEEVLLDKKVSEAALTAPGCLIDPGLPLAKPKATYHNRISRIIQNRCEGCHRPDGIAGLELSTYAFLNNVAPMARRMVLDKRMPPWPAEGDHVKNDISLTTAEREDLMQWLATKPRPEGDKNDAPVAYHWPKNWLIGSPDAIFATPHYDVPDTGIIDYQYFEVPTNFAEDRYVQQMEIKSAEPSVVHHVLVFVNTTVEEVKKGAGLRGFFMGMVPGQTSTIYPTGMGKTLPKGAKLVFQVHYTANGKAARDHTTIGLKFASKKPAIEIETNAAFTTEIDIAPFAKDVMIPAKYTFKKPTRILAFSPHMHARGVSFKYELIFPDGTRQVVMNVPRFDFNWQFTLWLRRPIDVPVGTVMLATGGYDNSTERNGMDPKQRVKFGEQTDDEMMIGYFFSHAR